MMIILYDTAYDTSDFPQVGNIYGDNVAFHGYIYNVNQKRLTVFIQIKAGLINAWARINTGVQLSK